MWLKNSPDNFSEGKEVSLIQHVGISMVNIYSETDEEACREVDRLYARDLIVRNDDINAFEEMGILSIKRFGTQS